MGIASTYGEAFAKAQISAGSTLPKEGKVFISVKDQDKRAVILIARQLADHGFLLVSTPGTAQVLRSNGIDVEEVKQYDQGKQSMKTLMDLMRHNEIKLIINTPSGESSQYDMRSIRAAAILHKVPCITTLQGAWAAVNGITTVESYSVKPLQAHYQTECKSKNEDTVELADQVKKS